LCCVVLCCIMLCCVVLCCVVLCCAVLCCAVLCCVVSCGKHLRHLLQSRPNTGTAVLRTLSLATVVFFSRTSVGLAVHLACVASSVWCIPRVLHPACGASRVWCIPRVVHPACGAGEESSNTFGRCWVETSFDVFTLDGARPCACVSVYDIASEAVTFEMLS
jgi:hypothetical protein